MTTDTNEPLHQSPEHPDHPHPHGFEIIVNARHHTVESETLRFEELVQLAFPGAQPDPNVFYSMTYRNAASDPRAGELGPGGTVTVKNGTIFNVTRTDKS